MFLKTIFSLVIFALAAFAGEYTATVSNETSKSITAATHGLGCSTKRIGVAVYNSSAVLIDRSQYSVSGDSSCNITVNFSGYFTGSVKLRGPFSLSNRSDDYEPAHYDIDESSEIVICPSCADNYYSYRAGIGVMEYPRYFRFTNVAQTSTRTVRVWMKDGVLYFGISASVSAVCTSSQGDCVVQTGVSAFPDNGEFRIAQGNMTYSAQEQKLLWTDWQDLRSF